MGIFLLILHLHQFPNLINWLPPLFHKILLLFQKITQLFSRHPLDGVTNFLEERPLAGRTNTLPAKGVPSRPLLFDWQRIADSLQRRNQYVLDCVGRIALSIQPFVGAFAFEEAPRAVGACAQGFNIVIVIAESGKLLRLRRFSEHRPIVLRLHSRLQLAARIVCLGLPLAVCGAHR